MTAVSAIRLERTTGGGFRRALYGVALGLILLGTFLLQLHHLGHPAVKPLDEVFHAIVARNLMRHPLTPTLVDRPYLPYDAANWQANYIWLHKPPMALWQIALCFKALGVSAGSLRLPSAVLSTAAVGLTFAIGAELLDPASGLIAAGLQAFNPVILMLVNGYVFSDHVDISLLFWTELAVYALARFLRTGRRVDLLICGASQGCAFLSKTWPALVVSGVAVVAWLLWSGWRLPAERGRVTWRALLWIAAGSAVVVVPWYASIVIRFQPEYATENLEILRHLNSNIEGWAGPWDRLVFDYCISIFYSFYPAVIVATLLVGARGWLRRELGTVLVLAWGLGVMGPNLLATSKTMSATLIGWPAFWLLLGRIIVLAWQGEGWAAGAWVASMAAGAMLRAGAVPTAGWGYPPAGAASIWRQHDWVIGHALIALLGSAVMAWVASQRVKRLLVIVAGGLMVMLLAAPEMRGRLPSYAVEARRVVQIDKQQPAFVATGKWSQHLPDNAAFLVDEHTKLENKLVEWATDRSCYAIEGTPWEVLAARLVKAGAIPYLVTPTPRALPLMFMDTAERRFVYACTPGGVAPGLRASRANQ